VHYDPYGSIQTENYEGRDPLDPLIALTHIGSDPTLGPTMATPMIDIISQEHPVSERITELESTVNAELSDEEEGADTDEVSHKIEENDQAQASKSKKKKKKRVEGKENNRCTQLNKRGPTGCIGKGGGASEGGWRTWFGKYRCRRCQAGFYNKSKSRTF
jgi:hypothetical protein